MAELHPPPKHLKWLASSSHTEGFGNLWGKEGKKIIPSLVKSVRIRNKDQTALLPALTPLVCLLCPYFFSRLTVNFGHIAWHSKSTFLVSFLKQNQSGKKTTRHYILIRCLSEQLTLLYCSSSSPIFQEEPPSFLSNVHVPSRSKVNRLFCPHA